jgi:hypothetical protein
MKDIAMTQTVSPADTGEIQIGEETTDLTRFYAAPPQSPLPRPELVDTIANLLRPIPPREFVVPTRDHSRSGKTLLPVARPADPEPYADMRARRGLEPLRRPRGYKGAHRHRRAGAR